MNFRAKALQLKGFNGFYLNLPALRLDFRVIKAGKAPDKGGFDLKGSITGLLFTALQSPWPPDAGYRYYFLRISPPGKAL
jgi:hypothetical protein